MDDPIFNLSFEEGFFDEEPRKCTYERRVTLPWGHDGPAMLVRVSPPYFGSRYCVDIPELAFVVVVPRSPSDTLFPISDWPVPVHVLLPLMKHPELLDSMSREEFQRIGIGLQKT